VGYNGSGDTSIADFQAQIKAFSKLVNWPYYNPPTPNSNIKLPGGYNIFAEDKGTSFYNKKPDGSPQPLLLNPDAGSNNTATQNIINQWNKWTNSSICGTDQDTYKNKDFCTAFQQDIKDIWGTYDDPVKGPQGFAGNAKKQGLPPQSASEIIKHIIGYVGFNDASGNSNIEYLNEQGINLKWIAVAEGIPYTTDRKTNEGYQNYKYPEFSSPYNLNPYVTFVHKKNYLNLNVYAFSIDDAVGNVREPGNGFTIAVAGLNGIANKTPYVPSTAYAYKVSPAPGWSKLSVCNTNYSSSPTAPPVARPITKDTCQIQLTAPTNPQTGTTQVVNITTQIDKEKSELTIVNGSCNDNMNQLCTGNQFLIDGTGTVLNTPPPSAGTGGPINLNWPPPSTATPPTTYPWKSGTVCGKSIDVNPGTAQIANTTSCPISFQAESGVLTFTATSTNGTWSVKDCGGTLSSLCSNNQIATDGSRYINLPSPPGGVTPPPPGINAHLYWGTSPAWTSVNICGTALTTSDAIAAGNAPVNSNSSSCAITFQAPGGNVSFTLNLNNPVSISDCKGTGTLCQQVFPNGTNVNLPPAPTQ
jgi:hypothetical protein